MCFAGCSICTVHIGLCIGLFWRRVFRILSRPKYWLLRSQAQGTGRSVTMRMRDAGSMMRDACAPRCPRVSVHFTGSAWIPGHHQQERTTALGGVCMCVCSVRRRYKLSLSLFLSFSLSLSLSLSLQGLCHPAAHRPSR